ncbi:hypothetical protein HVA01_08480 [Halovibrio variabilis]|uniref:Uncharacterized protein n=1 Tax=Halovibrio variabilis TaxID=31910 RepID=A0A511UPY5_9GAMM|nr:hypothetical protein HVA01_08480 [Halovibrio variabilis]
MPFAAGECTANPARPAILKGLEPERSRKSGVHTNCGHSAVNIEIAEVAVWVHAELIDNDCLMTAVGQQQQKVM